MSHSFKLLIIDDDESDQLLMRMAVHKTGLEAQISVAYSGDEGLEQARLLKPDFIILDSSMPGMNGFEVCRKIKSTDDHVKIIICTGVVDEQIINKSKSIGAEDCCLKTADYGLLVSAIKNAITS